MTPHTPDNGGEPSAAPSPVPAGSCPKCLAFCWMVLSVAPEHDQVRPSDPRQPCTVCPHCGCPVWLRLVGRPALARPAESKTTALIPRNRRTKRYRDEMAPTMIIRADSDQPPTDPPEPSTNGCADL